MNVDLNTKNIDEFIKRYPPQAQKLMKQLRELIHQEVPEAKEKISYGIPTFTLNGNLIHFAAYEKHIGLYPGAGPIADLKDDLRDYETAKGTVRFPIDKPLPYDLIRKLLHSAVARNQAKKKK